MFFILFLYALFVRSQDSDICRVLCLSGGGDKGSWEAGVLKGLLEHQSPEETRYDIVTGSSAGSLNAIGLGMYKIGDETDAISWIVDLWENIKKEDVYKMWPLGLAEGLLKPGLIDGTPLREWLTKHLDYEKCRQNDRMIFFETTELETGIAHFFNLSWATEHNLIVPALMASAAIPGVFSPQEINGKHYLDGGLVERVFVVQGIEKCYEKYPNSNNLTIKVDVIAPYIEGSAGGILKHTDESILILVKGLLMSIENDFINIVQKARDTFPKAEIRLITPQAKLPSFWLFFDHCKEMIEIGYKDALRHIKKMKNRNWN